MHTKVTDMYKRVEEVHDQLDRWNVKGVLDGFSEELLGLTYYIYIYIDHLSFKQLTFQYLIHHMYIVYVFQICGNRGMLVGAVVGSLILLRCETAAFIYSPGSSKPLPDFSKLCSIPHACQPLLWTQSVTCVPSQNIRNIGKVPSPPKPHSALQVLTTNLYNLIDPTSTQSSLCKL